MDGWRVAGLASVAAGREPDRVPTLARRRHRLELQATGRVGDDGRWRVRWRRIDEWRQERSRTEPWLRPEPRPDPPRTDWSLAVEHPAHGGQVRLRWRIKDDGTRTRQLLALGWRRDWPACRLRCQWQSAWGDDADLVTLAVPVRGYFAVQHWGRWRSGFWLGLEGRGRWGWQIAVLRRLAADPTAAAELIGQIGLRVTP
jgi:hypothetical protein